MEMEKKSYKEYCERRKRFSLVFMILFGIIFFGTVIVSLYLFQPTIEYETFCYDDKGNEIIGLKCIGKKSPYNDFFIPLLVIVVLFAGFALFYFSEYIKWSWEMI